MMRAIFIQSLRNRRWSWLIYGAIGLMFLVLYVGTFQMVQAQQADYEKILASMPKAVLEAFNISQTAPTLMGFMSSKHFGFTWPLMIILLMTSFAGGGLAGEIDRRSMGLALSLPVSRLRLYATRLAAGITGLAIFIGLSELLTWPLAKAFGYGATWGEVVNVGLLGLAFGFAVLGLAMMFSAMASESGKVAGAIGGLLLVMYVLNIIAELEPKLDALKFATLFHYFRPGEVVGSGSLDAVSILVLTGTGIIAAIIGAVWFNRRDISV